MGRPKLHEMRWTPTYTSWVHMKGRCTSQASTNWKQYGSKGVTICAQWMDFRNFFADMGVRPEGTTIDRIDNSKGYEPSNCRWATIDVQSKNRKTTLWVEFNGETLCLTDWAKRLGIKITTLCYRLKHWDKERALTEKVRLSHESRF